jgi:hypothetical protein
MDSQGQLTSVSCASSSFCVAVDRNGNAFVFSGNSWSSAESIDSQQDLTSLSCSSSSFCVAVDLGGNAITYNGTSWSPAQSVDSSQGLRSVSCLSSAFCVAVDGSGNAFTYDGTAWSGASFIDNTDVINSVSCPSSSFCVASDNSGNVVMTASSATPVVSVDGQAASLTSLLDLSSIDRSKLQNSVDVMQAAVQGQNGCSSGVSTAVVDLRQVSQGRQTLLLRLASVSLSSVPSGHLITSDLRGAWLISERIDNDFEGWAETELNDNCRISDAAVASYVATETLDPKSTAMKTRFVNLWNPIAARLHQPSSWTAYRI